MNPNESGLLKMNSVDFVKRGFGAGEDVIATVKVRRIEGNTLLHTELYAN
jgi:hypothetical protein